MARYKKIHVAMYADAKYRALSKPQPNGRSLWTYLLTGPHTTSVPGLSTVGEAALAESLDWPLEGFREAFAEVSSKGMAKADWKARVVWVPNAVKYNPPESPNVIKSWGKAWEEIPECALKVVAFTTLKDFVEGLPEAFREVFRKAFPESVAVAVTGTVAERDLSAGADVPTCPATDPANQQRASSVVGGNAGKGRGGRRKQKPTGEERPEHAEVRTYFCERWKARNGADYAWKYGRDDAHAKWVLDACGRDAAQAKAIVSLFLADEDRWVAERGHEISLLVARFNRYRAKPPADADDNGFVRAEHTDAEWDAMLLEGNSANNAG